MATAGGAVRRALEGIRARDTSASSFDFSPSVAHGAPRLEYVAVGGVRRSEFISQRANTRVVRRAGRTLVSHNGRSAECDVRNHAGSERACGGLADFTRRV